MLAVGMRHERLVVVDIISSNWRTGRIVVRCDCGTTKDVHRKRWGEFMSCGCSQKEAARQTGYANKTHGVLCSHARPREFRAWESAKRRCFNPSEKSYKNYGARGITMCTEWRDDFKAFLDHVGPCPSDDLTLDRKDVNGNYEPGNCRWATRKTQAINRRSSVFIEHDGRRMTVSDWAAEYGILDGTLRRRLKRGVPFSEAVNR